MSKTAKIVGIIVIIVVAYFWFFDKNQQKTATNEPIKIGAVYPLSGFLALYGETERMATEYAVDQINMGSGVNGRKLEIIYEDGECSGPDALTAVKKLIAVDKVRIVLGGSCSSETLAMAPYAKENGVLLFSSIASSPDISKMGNVFRNTIITKEEGEKLANLSKKVGHKKIAILTENNDYTLSLRDGLLSGLLAESVAYNELFNFGENDFHTYVSKIKNISPDAIFIFSVGGNGGSFVKQAREQKLGTQIYGAENPGTANFLELAGVAADGIIYTDVPTINEDNPQLKGLLNYYIKNGITPIGNYFAAARYDSVVILTDAIKVCGEDTNCISKTIKDTTHSGLLGIYNFDSNGDMRGLPITIRKIINGKSEVIE